MGLPFTYLIKDVICQALNDPVLLHPYAKVDSSAAEWSVD